MIRNLVGGILMAAGLVLSVYCGLPARVAHADSDKCCVPAHAATPAPPPGSGSTCYKDPSTMECLGGGNCGAIAWQDGVAGVCNDKPESTCNPNAAQTNVEIAKGLWSCGGDDCKCQWEDIGGLRDNVTVSNCTGDGC